MIIHIPESQQSRKGLVLDLLKHQPTVSGQVLADAAGISRNAVWKMINRLRREGYTIDSAPGRGYSLEQIPDRLLPEEIRSGLHTHIFGRKIISLPEVISTQAQARKLAEDGEPEGSVVLAERQTRGRGRLQRIWADLPGSIFMSLILRPETLPSRASHFPILAGVALARAVQVVAPTLAPRLKWPNDLQLQGKKCAGILAEMAAEPERIHYIVLGLGLNVNCPPAEMDEGLQDTATSLLIETGAPVSRTALLRNLLQAVEALYYSYQVQGFEPIKAEWKQWSNTLNTQVRVHSASETLEGLALDIDENGALIIQQANGRFISVAAGDVSLRPAR